MDYVEAIPSGLRRFTAVAESLGGVGLILPQLTGILPWLTPLAAVGLILVMVGAIIFHNSAQGISQYCVQPGLAGISGFRRL